MWNNSSFEFGVLNLELKPQDLYLKLQTPNSKLLTLLFTISLFSACKIYTFTGASVAPDIKSVNVQNFANQSENPNTAVNQDLTDQLKDRFVSGTNLTIVNTGGDIEFRGVITGYSIRGQAPTADQTTAVNRLTITVRVEYFNHKNESENWSQTFTRFNDYDGARNLADIEQQLFTSINAQLAEDIFNKAFVNW